MRYTCRPIYPTVKSFNTVAEVEVALGPWLSMSVCPEKIFANSYRYFLNAFDYPLLA